MGIRMIKTGPSNCQDHHFMKSGKWFAKKLWDETFQEKFATFLPRFCHVLQYLLRSSCHPLQSSHHRKAEKPLMRYKGHSSPWIWNIRGHVMPWFTRPVRRSANVRTSGFRAGQATSLRGLAHEVLDVVSWNRVSADCLHVSLDSTSVDDLRAVSKHHATAFVLTEF